MIKHYCDHRHLKLLEKLKTEQGPRWMNHWVLEQKRKKAKKAYEQERTKGIVATRRRNHRDCYCDGGSRIILH